MDRGLQLLWEPLKSRVLRDIVPSLTTEFDDGSGSFKSMVGPCVFPAVQPGMQLGTK